MCKTILLFLAGSLLLLAQFEPVPPVPPEPPQAPLAPLAPIPPMAPMPAMALMPPMPPMQFEFQERAFEKAQREFERGQREFERTQRDFERVHRDFQFTFDNHKLAEMNHEISMKVAAKVNDSMSRFEYKMPAFAMAPLFQGKTTDHQRTYERGVQSLDGRHYERALEAFSQVASSTGPRTDAALFWKAYTLHRLGRRDEALSTLAEMRKTYAASRWTADAQALEAQIKASTGQIDSAAVDSAEDLKVIALTGLIQSDPDKAWPMVEQILKSSPSRKLKERALHTIANSDSQRGRDLLAQIARGKVGNPDLEIRAIHYLGNRRNDNRQLLREIYSSSTDEHVKRAVLRALGSNEDKEQLIQIVKTEKEPSLRMDAVGMLGRSASSAELWPLYQAETSVEVKERILQRLRDLEATDRLLEVAKTEKEPKLREQAIRSLGSGTTGDALVTLYASATDSSLKRSILDALYSHKNGKAMVELARKEKDMSAKREIVSRLSRLHSNEATEYLAEILK